MSSTATAVADLSGPPAGDPLRAAVDQLSTVLGSVVDQGAWTVGDTDLVDLVSGALRVRAGVDELITRLVGEVTDRGLPRQHGHTSPTAWLAATGGLSRREAGGIVARTRTLTGPDVEQTRRAWASGDLSSDQAHVIATAITGLHDDVEPDDRVRAERFLLDQARLLTHRDLQTVANRILEVVDPDGAEHRLGLLLAAQEARAWQHTELRIWRRGDGTTMFRGRLPDLHADLLITALDACTAPRHTPPAPDAPDAGAAGSSGSTAGPDTSAAADPATDSDDDGVPVSYPQRLGRALCELLEHLPTTKLPRHGVANATLVITLDHDTLTRAVTGATEATEATATTSTGTVISAGQARRLACNADLIPAVLNGPSHVLDLGHTKRLYDQHQRTALALRDGGCVWPHCDRPASWTEAHHLTAWSAHGPTDLDNGCLVCPHHHRLLHHGGWQARRAPDGIIEVTPPDHIDPTRTPRRHHRFRPKRADDDC